LRILIFPKRPPVLSAMHPKRACPHGLGQGSFL
jgi:hypothetical protein